MILKLGLSIELKSGENSSSCSNLREHIYSYFMDRGILMRPVGNVFYFYPTWIITEQEIDYMRSAIASFLTDLANQ